jgi:hypothetical protein
MFSRGKATIYERLKEVRDTKGFHVDVDHFKDWIKQLQAPEVTLWRKDSGSPFDWIFSASAQIQSFLGAQLDEETVLALQDLLMLVQLVEAMCCGLVAEAGLDLGTCYQRTVRREVRLEYSFTDGRLARTQMTEAVIDQSGNPQGAVGDLRDEVTRTIGGRRAGARAPGEGCDITFFGEGGSARAWFGPVVLRQTTAPDDRLAVVRMSDMATWGDLWTKRMTSYVHAVRTAAVTGEMTATLLAELERDLSYWRERREESEAMAKRLREKSGVP